MRETSIMDNLNLKMQAHIYGCAKKYIRIAEKMMPVEIIL